MKDDTKCFIKNNQNKYIEILYSELKQFIRSDPKGKTRWFIPVQGMLLEVNQDEYKEYYRQMRRQKYLREEAARVGVVSYELLEQLACQGCTIDYSEDVEQYVINRVTVQIILKNLTKQELDLIRMIYYAGEKERDIAEKFGISQQAVHKRLKKILEKLKNF